MKFSSFLLYAGLVFGVATRSTYAVEFEKVLLPLNIFSPGIPGAFGSLWKTEIIARNDGDETVIVQPARDPGHCVINECPQFDRGAHTTFPIFGETVSGAPPGQGKFVSKPANEHVSFNLRVYDASRTSVTWGTEIPVVRENEARTETVTLLNVPTDARFRTTLRVYDFDGNFGRNVLVRFFAADGQQPLSESVLTLTVPNFGGDPGDSPGFAQIGNFPDAFPQLAAFDRLRVEVVPMTPGLHFWTFISVTNNDTQQVTTITPH